MEQNKQKYKIKKVGPYLLLKQIGSGAFATVYKSKIEKSYEKVAVKMISINKLSERILLRVQQEIEILNKIKHENIVRILDFKKSDNNWYLIFEYCEHGDLDNYIKKYFNGFLTERKAQQIIQQLSSAFQLLQELKIVHRDLKLANILVGKDFIIKIADFGFAKCMDDQKLLTSHLGTPITMAPEILEGNKYNEKCDIWSLGVIIYQMVMGKPPFLPPPGQKINGLKDMINKGLIYFDPQHPITNELKDLITKMLVKDPVLRMGFPEFFQHQWVTNNCNQKNLEKDVDLSCSLRIVKEERKKSLLQTRAIYKQNINANKVNSDKDQQQEKDQQQTLNQFNNQQIQKQQTNNFIQQKQLQQQQQQQQQQQIVNVNKMQNYHKLDQYLENKQIVKLSYESILMMNISLQLRKYFEKNVVGFIAGLNQLKQFFDCHEPKFRTCQFLSCLLISFRIHRFLSQKIILEYQSQQIIIQSYSYFSGLFLEKGQQDINNFALLLNKKMEGYIQMLQQFQIINQQSDSSSCSGGGENNGLDLTTNGNVNNNNNVQMSSSLFSEQYLLEDNYSIEYLLIKVILDLASCIERDKLNYNLMIKNLQLCASIYEKIVLPDNYINLEIHSKKLSENELKKIIDDFSKGLFQKLQIENLKSYRFFEEYRKHDDCFSVNIITNQEPMSQNLKQFNELYKNVFQWIQSLTQINQFKLN